MTLGRGCEHRKFVILLHRGLGSNIVNDRIGTRAVCSWGTGDSVGGHGPWCQSKLGAISVFSFEFAIHDDARPGEPLVMPLTHERF